MSNATSTPPSSRQSPAFATTHWSVVLAAGGDDSHEAKNALATLCETYWFPLYAFARRQGHSPHDAEDLTQSFFALLLERKDLRELQPDRGKFRSFLLACMQHFLSNEYDRKRAVKRGGGKVIRSLNTEAAERRYNLEPVENETPERVFQRNWALTLLDRTLESLKMDFTKSDNTTVYEQLKVFLTGENSSKSYAEIGADLGMSEDAVKSTVYRLRRRFRARMREEIAQTVANPDEVDEELRNLFEVLSGAK